MDIELFHLLEQVHELPPTTLTSTSAHETTMDIELFHLLEQVPELPTLTSTPVSKPEVIHIDWSKHMENHEGQSAAYTHPFQCSETKYVNRNRKRKNEDNTIVSDNTKCTSSYPPDSLFDLALSSSRTNVFKSNNPTEEKQCAGRVRKKITTNVYHSPRSICEGEAFFFLDEEKENIRPKYPNKVERSPCVAFRPSEAIFNTVLSTGLTDRGYKDSSAEHQPELKVMVGSRMISDSSYLDKQRLGDLHRTQNIGYETKGLMISKKIRNHSEEQSECSDAILKRLLNNMKKYDSYEDFSDEEIKSAFSQASKLSRELLKPYYFPRTRTLNSKADNVMRFDHLEAEQKDLLDEIKVDYNPENQSLDEIIEEMFNEGCFDNL